MAVVMLVADADAGEPVVGPDIAERISDLGITRLVVLRDGRSTGVVLEGWAFDPVHTDEAVEAIFPAGGFRVRTFRQIEQVAVARVSDSRRAS
jgi:hypothetical protein